MRALPALAASLLLFFRGSFTASADLSCPVAFSSLSQGAADYTEKETGELKARIEALPQPFRLLMKRSLRKGLQPLAENAEGWQIAERVRQLEKTRRLTAFVENFLFRGGKADDAVERWVRRSLLRDGLLPALKRQGLTFNPEELGRVRRFLDKAQRSRALSVLLPLTARLPPASIPPTDLAVLPPDLLESVLRHGLAKERPAAQAALGASLARYYEAESALKAIYKMAFTGYASYKGVEAYQKFLEEQGSRAKEDFFRKLDEIESTLGELDKLAAEKDEVPGEEAGEGALAPPAKP